jgi:hypothetical protein
MHANSITHVWHGQLLDTIGAWSWSDPLLDIGALLHDCQPETLGEIASVVVAHLLVVVTTVHIFERGDTGPLGVCSPHEPLEVRVVALDHDRTILRGAVAILVAIIQMCRWSPGVE